MTDELQTREDDSTEYEGPEVPAIMDPEQQQAAAGLNQEVVAAEDAKADVADLTARTDPRVYNDRPNGAQSISGILLHHTGSPSEDGDAFWLSQFHENPVSVHKLIKRSGLIVKIVPEEKRAWHAGLSAWHGTNDCNNTMIGYEICNRGNGEAFTDAQYEVIAQSIAYDCAVYHIPDANVTTHKAVRDMWLQAHPGTAARKNDPLGLDMDRVWARVRALRADWPFGPAVALWADPMP